VIIRRRKERKEG